MPITKEEILAMTLQEKTDLLDMIMETIQGTSDDTETVEEVNMLRETLAEYHRDPSIAVKGDIAMQQLRSRHDGV